ncbi:MAG: hypothetical protein V8Q54_08200 [Alistipes senegalensis]
MQGMTSRPHLDTAPLAGVGDFVRLGDFDRKPVVAARLHDHGQPVRHRADHLITGRNGFAPAVYQHHFAVAVRPRGYGFAEFVAEGEPHDSQVFVEAQIAEIQGGIEPIRNGQFTRRADVAVLFRLADQGPVAAERMRLGVTDIVEPIARRIGIVVIEFRPVMMFLYVDTVLSGDAVPVSRSNAAAEKKNGFLMMGSFIGIEPKLHFYNITNKSAARATRTAEI